MTRKLKQNVNTTKLKLKYNATERKPT